MKFKFFSLVLLLLLLAVAALSALAQDMPEPQVTVGADNLILSNAVDIQSVYSAGPGFVVIHRTSDGGVVGVSAPLAAGWSYNVRINLDPALVEPQMSAMLHVDDNTVGTYEFGTVEGADGPVRVGENIVNPIFSAQVLSATDQFVSEGTVTIRTAVVAADGFVVIHSGDAGSFGPVLGYAPVTAGINNDVVVQVSGELTDVLWPMLHLDTGTAGTYEFGTVEGADGPVVVGGKVAAFPIWTVPHVRTNDQIVVRGDGMEANMTPSIRVLSALLAEPGFVVIHKADGDSFGGVAGVSDPLPAGLSTNLDIALDAAEVTPVLWPMAHVDTGEVGVYEFGTVEGADGPVVNGDQVVTFPVKAAPSLTMSDQALTDGALVIEKAIIDAPGWLAIHSNNNGAPGPVIATALLHPGANWNIVIPVDAAQAGELVFPMLHYDTGEIGVYEFGTVEGADAPTFVGEQVIVAPLAITP